MKYLFTYEYKGKNNGRAENGSGSCEMTVTGTDKITPKLIQMAVEYVKNDMEKKRVSDSPWIPCGERLPEKEVLCCDIDNNIMLGYVFVDMSSESGFSAENENCFMYECVAWMPKPKGYNGGEKE